MSIWLSVALILVMIIGFVLVYFYLARIRRALDEVSNTLAPKARQSSFAGYQLGPAVMTPNHSPRTTRRDTDDIPSTGRQSRIGNITSQGGDLFDRVDPNSGLPQRPGTPTAQVGQAEGQDPQQRKAPNS